MYGYPSITHSWGLKNLTLNGWKRSLSSMRPALIVECSTSVPATTTSRLAGAVLAPRRVMTLSSLSPRSCRQSTWTPKGSVVPTRLLSSQKVESTKNWWALV